MVLNEKQKQTNIHSQKEVRKLSRKNAAAWYENYCKRHAENPSTSGLTDEDVNKLVHELR